MTVTIGRKKMPLSEVVIPDLWPIGQMMEADRRYELHAKAVLDCWTIAHGLKRVLEVVAAKAQMNS